MARPNKQGVDYFSLDVHLDDKWKFVQIKYGLQGFAIVVKLLQRIYSCGYWCKWTDDESLLFADEHKADYDLVRNVVTECIDRGIFDKEIYYEHSVLTSKGVQKRYKEIVRRRKDVEVVSDYLLIDGTLGITDSELEVNDDINPTDGQQDDGKSTQTKLKESKVINSAFEKLWLMYPEKKGKGKISDAKKADIHKSVGIEQFQRCIERYIAYVKSKEWLKYQNGSTFFNSGYVDYLDKNYEEEAPARTPYKKVE